MARRGGVRRRQVGARRRSRPQRCAPGFARLLGDVAGEHRARAEHARAGHALALRAAAARRGRGIVTTDRRVPHHSAPARSAGRGRTRDREGRRRDRSTRSPSAWPRRSTTARHAVLVSSVFFETAEIVPGLDELAAGVRATRRRLLVDAYHHLNVVPFDVRRWALSARSSPAAATSIASSARATAFFACPPGEQLRPVLTGWFAEFDRLAVAPAARRQLSGRRRCVRRRHLRPDVALSRRRGVRFPPAAGPDRRAVARHQPAAGRTPAGRVRGAGHRPWRRASRHHAGGTAGRVSGHSYGRRARARW